MGSHTISMVLSLLVVIFVGYGSLTKSLNYHSGGTMLLSVLAYWAQPPNKSTSNVEEGESGEE